MHRKTASKAYRSLIFWDANLYQWQAGFWRNCNRADKIWPASVTARWKFAMARWLAEPSDAGGRAIWRPELSQAAALFGAGRRVAQRPFLRPLLVLLMNAWRFDRPEASG